MDQLSREELIDIVLDKQNQIDTLMEKIRKRDYVILKLKHQLNLQEEGKEFPREERERERDNSDRNRDRERERERERDREREKTTEKKTIKSKVVKTKQRRSLGPVLSKPITNGTKKKKKTVGHNVSGTSTSSSSRTQKSTSNGNAHATPSSTKKKSSSKKTVKSRKTDPLNNHNKNVENNHIRDEENIILNNNNIDQLNDEHNHKSPHNKENNNEDKNDVKEDPNKKQKKRFHERGQKTEDNNEDIHNKPKSINLDDGEGGSTKNKSATFDDGEKNEHVENITKLKKILLDPNADPNLLDSAELNVKSGIKGAKKKSLFLQKNGLKITDKAESNDKPIMIAYDSITSLDPKIKGEFSLKIKSTKSFTLIFNDRESLQRWALIIHSLIGQNNSNHGLSSENFKSFLASSYLDSIKGGSIVNDKGESVNVSKEGLVTWKSQHNSKADKVTYTWDGNKLSCKEGKSFGTGKFDGLKVEWYHNDDHESTPSISYLWNPKSSFFSFMQGDFSNKEMATWYWSENTLVPSQDHHKEGQWVLDGVVPSPLILLIVLFFKLLN